MARGKGAEFGEAYPENFKHPTLACRTLHSVEVTLLSAGHASAR